MPTLAPKSIALVPFRSRLPTIPPQPLRTARRRRLAATANYLMTPDKIVFRLHRADARLRRSRTRSAARERRARRRPPAPADGRCPLPVLQHLHRRSPGLRRPGRPAVAEPARAAAGADGLTRHRPSVTSGRVARSPRPPPAPWRRPRAPVAGRVDDAAAQVLLEQPERDRLQRLGRGAHLGQHVDAVLVLFDHARDAANLSLDAAQPLEIVVPVRRCIRACGHDTPRGYRRQPAQPAMISPAPIGTRGVARAVPVGKPIRGCSDTTGGRRS